MTQDFRETEIEFYGRCAEILGVAHAFKERFSERTRWNNRMPGNGRFPGFGLVRMFVADRIHVSLHAPVVSRTFGSREEVYEFLHEVARGRAAVERSPSP
jgi:hypothetical protein